MKNSELPRAMGWLAFQAVIPAARRSLWNFRSAADHGSSLESNSSRRRSAFPIREPRQFQRTVQMFQRGRAESEAPRRWRHHRGTRIGPTRSVPEM